MRPLIFKPVSILYLLLLLPYVVFSAEKKVLVIESYHKEMFWDAGYRKGITNTLGGSISVDFFEMNTKRIPKSAYPARVKSAISVIDNTKPDLVMLGDDNALSFLGEEVLSRNIPLVFLGINNNPRLYFNNFIPNGMTGVLEKPLLKRHLEIINIIEPKWKKILVLFDDSVTSNIYKNDSYFYQGMNELNVLGLSIEVYLTGSYEDLQAKVKSAQSEKSVLFLGGLNTLTDINKKHVSADKATNWIYHHSKIPLFGFWRGTVGSEKAVDGYVIDGEAMGSQAATLALKILHGTRPENLPIEKLTGGRLVLSRSGLDHWNIKIPEGLSEIAEYID